MTSPAELAHYTDRVVGEIDGIFGPRTVGVWLIGSHAYGGANEGSDIDIQACVQAADRSEVLALADRIAHPALPCPAVGLEFVLYDLDTLTSPSPPLRWLLNLNGGPEREHKVSTDSSTESWHWFVLDLALGRATARTLAGRGLAEVLGPIDRDMQARAIAQSQRWHQSHDAGNPNQVANAARGLRFLRSGRWGSKPEGLAWARSVGYQDAEVVAGLSEALQQQGLWTPDGD